MEKRTIEEFEKDIFDSEKNQKVIYKIESEIEAIVIYEYLSEKYGKDEVDKFMKDSGKTNLDLLDPSFRISFDEKFKEI